MPYEEADDTKLGKIYASKVTSTKRTRSNGCTLHSNIISASKRHKNLAKPNSLQVSPP
jgi:hypothetical protein